MVKVLTGSDRGKQGRVLRVFPDKGTVLVEHVRVVKKTVSAESRPAHQGRHRRAGIADQYFERGAGLPELRYGQLWIQDGRHHQGADLQDSAGHELPTKK